MICNSGMRNSVARPIFERCMTALSTVGSCKAVFGHPGKVVAIDAIWANRAVHFAAYVMADDPLAALATLPYIGSITKYHLARNLGADYAKPDVHLNRLAEAEQVDAQALCERLAAESGYRVGTVEIATAAMTFDFSFGLASESSFAAFPRHITMKAADLPRSRCLPR